MKLVICTKFQVNRMNCVESRRGGGVPIDPPSIKASCNYFFWKASRVKLKCVATSEIVAYNTADDIAEAESDYTCATLHVTVSLIFRG